MKNHVLTPVVLIFVSVAVVSTTSYGEVWRFVATGDSWGFDNGVNTIILGEIASETIAQGADLILFAGDLVSGISPVRVESELLTWRGTMQGVYDAGIGVYVVRGNHDWGIRPTDPNYLAAWNSVFSGRYGLPGNGPDGEKNLTWSLTHKNAFFIGLDVYGDHPQRVNQSWLEGELAQKVQPHVFVFTHEPAFQTGHGDCLDDFYRNRDLFWNSLAGAGGRVYFCAHDHFFNHAHVDDNDGDPNNDVHQFIVGTSGSSLYTWGGNYNGENSGFTLTNISHAKQYGYVLVEVNGLEVTLTWMGRDSDDLHMPGVYAAGGVWRYRAGRVPPDFDTSGNVGPGDLEYLIGRWLDSYCKDLNHWCDGADLDQSSTVDLNDFDILVRYWTGL